MAASLKLVQGGKDSIDRLKASNATHQPHRPRRHAQQNGACRESLPVLLWP